MDLYLARSFVACLTIDDFVQVVDDEHLPIEVCCAAMVYWLRQQGYGNVNKVCSF